MSEKFSKEKRSKIMSSIRGRDTSPEKELRKALFKLGYRYRLRKRFGDKDFSFYPDITMVSHKLCIFVDGCFWHGCPRCYKEPKSNRNFWISKVSRNIDRDRQQTEYLKKNSWKVVRVWEHEIKEDIKKVFQKVLNEIG